MLKKLALSGIAVFGICSFSLPKVLAQSTSKVTPISCSNYWVNPHNGKEECLDAKLQVVTEDSNLPFGGNNEEIPSNNNNTDVTQQSNVPQGGNYGEIPSNKNNTVVTQQSNVPQGQNGNQASRQNRNRAYMPLNSRKFYHVHDRQNRVHFSPTTSYRHIQSQGSVTRVRGIVGDSGSARSVRRIGSDHPYPTRSHAKN